MFWRHIYCILFEIPKRKQTIQGQTTQDVVGSNPDYVYIEESEEESGDANVTSSNESSPVI